MCDWMAKVTLFGFVDIVELHEGEPERELHLFVHGQFHLFDLPVAAKDLFQVLLADIASEILHVER